MDNACTVFISYARKGEGSKYLREISDAAKIMMIDVDTWTDQDSPMGENWQTEIENKLKQASAAILLIDWAFLASAFINDRELPAFLAKLASESDRFLLIPLLVEPCVYEAKMPWINAWPMEPESSMRRQLDPVKEKYADFLTLGNLANHPDQLAAFKGKLVMRLAQHCETIPPPLQNEAQAGPTSSDQPRGALPLLVDSPSRYLARGKDVSSYVDLQLDFASTEFDLYRIDLKYYYRDDPERGSLFATGRAEIASLDAGVAGDVGLLLDVPLRPISQQGAFSPPDSCGGEGACAQGAEREDRKLGRYLTEAVYKADELEVPLQLRIGIRASAGELNELRWEGLVLPEHGETPLCKQQGVLFSRIAISGGDEPVESQTRTRDSLRALCVYSDSGRDVGDRGDALKSKGIVEAMEKALGPLTNAGRHSTGLVRPDRDLLCQKLEELDPFDVLYLACEATCCANDYFLRLSGGDISRSDLARRLRHGVVPRLVILAPTHQLDEVAEDEKSGNAILHFAPVFAQLGAAAVLTCSKRLKPEHWRRFFDAFTRALVQHGHVAGAVAQARQRLAETEDWWKPVLITRIKAARLWYEPGFVSLRAAGQDWDRLKNSLEDGKLCPVLGPGFFYRIEQTRLEIAREMADEYAYPLSSFHRIHLPAVAQYVKILSGGEDIFFRKLEGKIRHRWQALSRPASITGNETLHRMAYKVARDILEKQPDNPYNLLVRIPARLFLTTNLDPTLEAALDLARGGDQGEPGHRRTSYDVFNFTDLDVFKSEAAGEAKLPTFELTAERPLIVQLYGSYERLRKAVISEDDLLEFLRTFNERVMEGCETLTGQIGRSDLVFLGFRWNSLEFRVLFRALHRYANSMPATSHHIAVQIDPDDDETLNQEKALEYLQRYFSGEGALQRVKISIYLGSTVDFLKHLCGGLPGIK
jgi:hypothetical protein